MSLRDQIVCLEALATIDSDLRRIDDQLSEERDLLANMTAELRKLEEKLSADRASVSEMEKARGDLSVELRQMTVQIERSREKLSRSRNERESNAAQRELEELRKLSRDREEEINKLAVLLEAAKKTIEESEAQQKKIADELGGRESDVSAKMAAVMRDRDEKQAERGRLAKTVEPMTLRRYERVRQQRDHAIAKTVDGICLSCHMRLPPMLFQKLMRGEAFEQCPSCARILYYEAPADTQQRGSS